MDKNRASWSPTSNAGFRISPFVLKAVLVDAQEVLDVVRIQSLHRLRQRRHVDDFPFELHAEYLAPLLGPGVQVDDFRPKAEIRSDPK